jgi:hypothetical protein
MTSAGAAFRMAFSSRSYAALAAVVAAAFWIIFNVLDGLLLLSPLNFYYPIPQDTVPGFILSNITAPLVGVITSMNAYVFRNSRARVDKPSFLSGSTLGTVLSMCVGCSSVVCRLLPCNHLWYGRSCRIDVPDKLPAPAPPACNWIAGMGTLLSTPQDNKILYCQI